MHRFFVAVGSATFKALAELAIEERRDVRDQAAVLIERALQTSPAPRIRGAPPPEPVPAPQQESPVPA